jgi:hypothetical protein
MNYKEKLLLKIIILLLGAVMSYRIAYVDSELAILENRINKLIEAKQ